jgi:phenylacetic acid degradation operon negative regulatory protein
MLAAIRHPSGLGEVLRMALPMTRLRSEPSPGDLDGDVHHPFDPPYDAADDRPDDPLYDRHPFPDDAEPPVDLPRAQAGAQPQHLLVTLFADYWLGRPEHLPSAGLVALTGEFGVSATSARAALSRLARRGLLTSSKSGRNTFYGLTRKADRALQAGHARMASFGRMPAEPWDGTWVVVVFSVPEERRDIRHALRSRLRWLGFAPLYDGVWVSPRPAVAEASDAVRTLGVEHATVLESVAPHPAPGDPGHPLAAWDLDALRAGYEQFVARFEPVRARVHSGRVSAAEALVTRTEVREAWRSFPARDPGLPASMLPDCWPRDAAREIFADVYDELGPLAELRFRQVLADVSPPHAELARHTTTAMTVAT